MPSSKLSKSKIQFFVSAKSQCIFGFVLVFFLACLAYANTLTNGLIWDDLLIISTNPYLSTPSQWWRLFTIDVHHFSLDTSNFYRPLQLLSYGFDQIIGQGQAWMFHLTSVISHGLCAGLLFLVMRQWLIIKFLTKDEQHYPVYMVAVATAALWAIHPIHAQAVSYVAGRADIFVTAAMLLVCLAWLRQWSMWTLFLGMGVGLLSKEYAVITPIWLLGLEAASGGLKRMTGQRWRQWLLLVVMVAGYLVVRFLWLWFPSAFSAEQMPGWSLRLATGLSAFLLLVRSLLLPMDLSMIRNIPFASSWWQPDILINAVLLVMIVAVFWFYRRSWPVGWWAIVWLLVAWLPFWGFVPMNANASEHWMYLASAGLLLLCVDTVFRLFVRWQKISVAVGMVVVIGLISMAAVWQRNNVFKNELVFFRHMIKQHPRNVRMHYNLGTALALAEKYQEAAVAFQNVLELDPQYAQAYANLGLITYKWQRIDEAITLYQKANELRADLVENHVNLGNALAKKGQRQAALESFQNAIKWRPDHPAALNGIGIEFAKQQQWPQARQWFERALAAQPDFQPAQDNMQRLIHMTQNSSQP